MTEENRRSEAIKAVLGLYPIFRKYLIPSVETNKLPVTKTALRVLMSLSDLHPVTMSRLAEETAISPQQLSKIITELEAEGYVERVNDREHRRLVWAGLTEKGQVLVDGHREQIDASFLERFALFSDEELQQIIESCHTVKGLVSKLPR